jgi:RHS repeat-associated protein
MTLGTSWRLAAALLALTACRAGFEADDPDELERLTPASVSSVGAWSLFDRSISSAYIPSAEPLRVAFDRAEAIAAIKVYGPAPYLLRVSGRDGSSLGFGSIDLSKLKQGWQLVPSSTLASTDVVELRFTPTGQPGKVPELELWTVGTGAAAKLDFASPEVPHGFVELVPGTRSEDLTPGDCATFEIPSARISSVFERAYLVYEAEGLFRSFALQRSINGLAEYGGTWLSGDFSRRTFVDEIDPAALQLGTNELRLCLGTDATRGVALSKVRIIGDLDLGVGLAKTANQSADRATAAITDGDPQTSVEVSAGERIVMTFDRLVAPDALRLVTSSAVPLAANVECVGADGAAKPLVTLRSTAELIQLDGGRARCASLGITFASAVSLAEIDVIGSGAGDAVDWPRVVVTSAPEHFGDVAWVGGFISRPREMTGAIRVEVASQQADAMTGDFGRLLGRPGAVATPWAVDVKARFPNSTELARQLVLERDQRALLATTAPDANGTKQASTPKTPFGEEGASVVTRARMLEATTIRLGTKVGVDLPIGAVQKTTDITVRHLGEDVLPPLDPGMINVTAPRGRGYEFLPHKQKFLKPVEVVVPYDPTLIPDGMSPEDIHTYFYDEKAERWKPIERKTIDVGERVLRSTSDHFTIMINAVLAVPKNPAPLSHDPTALSSIAAASPAANIDLVEPPQAISSGDARLGIPIRLPAGRGAYTPSVNINYNSAGGNGWLGIGWDLALSRVEIDTRWGVPAYGQNEEPRYLLDGAELVPTLEDEGPRCQDGRAGRRYHLRVEGAFAHVLRCNHAPGNVSPAAHYGFEVHDRSGTLFIYGVEGAEDPDSDEHHTALTDPEAPHSIFRWHLRKIIDVHGNTTTFEYFADNTGGAQPGRDIYPKAIKYTSHPTKVAAYEVRFDLSAGRPDRIVSGRAGFKTVTQKLLRRVRVLFDEQVIRDYVLTYHHGQFEKSVLESIRLYGVGGCEPGWDAFSTPSCAGAAFFHEHAFNYYEEEEAFDPPLVLATGGPQHVQALPLGKGSTRSETWGANAAVRRELGDGSVGASIGGDITSGDRRERTGVYDANGDGLPDQVYLIDTAVAAALNRSTPSGIADVLFVPQPGFELVESATRVLSTMGRESSSSWGVHGALSGGNDFIGGSLSAGYSSALSTSRTFISDLNGDGFVDMLRAPSDPLNNPDAMLGRPCQFGLCFDPVPFGAIHSIDPRRDPVVPAMYDTIRERLFRAAPVVQWTAPFTGRIVIDSTARKVNGGGLDGVAVELTHQDTPLSGMTLAPEHTSIVTLANAMAIDVQAGDALYLRVLSLADDGLGPNGTLLDLVDTGITATYQTICDGALCEDIFDPLTPHEPTGARVYQFDSRADYRIAGRPTFFVAPTRGTIEMQSTLTKRPSASDLRVCLQRYATPTADSLPDIDTPCDATGGDATNVTGTFILPAQSTASLPLNLSLPIDAGQLIMLRVESDFSFDPDGVALVASSPDHPALSFSNVCIPDGTSFTCSTDPADIALFSLPDLSQFGPYIALKPAPASPPVPAVAPQDDLVLVQTIDTIPSLSFLDGVFAIRSDRQGILLQVDCRVASCSVPPISPFTVSTGESITFELIGSASFSRVNVAFQSGSTFEVAVVNTPTGFADAGPTPFVGGFHGFRAALWNEREPFAPTALLADVESFEVLSAERQIQIRRSIASPDPSFGGNPITGGERAWLGFASAAFVTANTLNPGYLGAVAPASSGEPSPTVDGGGLFTQGYVRLSATESFFLGVSARLTPVNVFNFSGNLQASKSTTKTTTDVVDMNGDGIADVIAGDETRFGAFTADPDGAGMTTGFRFRASDAEREGFRRRQGYDYSIGFGAGVGVNPCTSAAGRTLSMCSGVAGANTGLGFDSGVAWGLGRTQTTEDLTDVNGDGLPDVVKRRGPNIVVRLNLGNRFGAEEPFGEVDQVLRAPVDSFQDDFEDTTCVAGECLNSSEHALSHTTTLTESSTKSLDLLVYSESVTKKKSATRTTRDLADINGDGMPDLLLKRDCTRVPGDPSAGEPCDQAIRVQFNRGGDFGPAVRWETPDWTYSDGTRIELSPDFDPEVLKLFTTGADVLGGSGLDTSTTSSNGVGIVVPIGESWTFSLGGSKTVSSDNDSYDLALLDIDGDGAADHVLRRQTVAGTPTVYVKKNRITGRANLLRTAHGPLGGTVTLHYARVGNTVEMPQSKHVLSQVEVDDGVDLGAAFDSPALRTTFAYENGVFSRNEKEFFGFRKVTSRRADGVTQQDEYDTTSYSLQGLLTKQTQRDHFGTMFFQRVVTREVQGVRGPDGDVLAVDPQCVDGLHPLLRANGVDACTPRFPVVMRDDEIRSEDGTITKTRTVRDLAFDRFGNVLASIDEADDSIANDDLYSQATYDNQISSSGWILGRTRTLEVRAGGAGGSVLRSRTGDYDDRGNLIAVHVATGSGTATTTLGYDVFGNLEQFTTPPNAAGQTQSYQVTFDTRVATYPVEMRDAFLHTSRATYDLRFGIATSETDLNNATIARTLDEHGRLKTVRGPYDLAAPALTMEYFPHEIPARAKSTMRTSAPASYTGPLPGADIVSVMFVDGGGDTVAQRKTAVKDGVSGMTTTGLHRRDNVGRMIMAQNPFFVVGASDVLGALQVTDATLTTYDDQDRAVATTYADSATETASFAIEVAPGGSMLFRARNTDPVGNARETFGDQVGRTRAFVEHSMPNAAAVTRYSYLPTGEISQITDAEGNQTTLGYDLRGLTTSMSNPDTGLIEQRFDSMGNRIALIEPNHRALGVEIRYAFNRDRLEHIDYPSKPDVTYQYGAPGEGRGRAGRLSQVSDESGTQKYFYGALGEITQTERTIAPAQQGGQTTTFVQRNVSDSFGRLLQLTYPDGFVITNQYDAAGMLSRVDGAGAGWSRTYASEIQYDEFGNRTRMRFGNGVVSTWTYDPKRLRLATAVTTLPSQKKIQNLSYTYFSNNNPRTITNGLAPLFGGSGNQPGDSTLELSYDGVDRLTSSQGSAQLTAQKRTEYVQTFQYSASHNLVHKERAHLITQPGQIPTAPSDTNFSSPYLYGAARPHLPNQIGDLTLTYDPSGNPTIRRKQSTGSQQNLVWDDDNRLVDFTSGGVHQHNTFDASGNRVRRKSTQRETVFANQYFDVENGTQGVRHVFAGGSRVASELGKFEGGDGTQAPNKRSTVYFFHHDHLGSTSVLTAEDASVHESVEYFSDGETWIDRGPQTPINGYLFSGKPFDPDTGFYDFGQRFYDPRTSLWLGIDPALQANPTSSLGDPMLLSPLAYAAWSPVLLTDPDGRYPGLSDIGGFAADLGKAAYRGARKGVTKLQNFASNAYHDPVGTAWGVGKRAAFPLLALQDDAHVVAEFSADMYIAARDKGWKGVVEKLVEKGGEYAVYYGAGRVAGKVTQAAKNVHGRLAQSSTATSTGVQPAGAATTGETVNLSTAGRTPAEAAAIREYARRTNAWLQQNGPQTIVSTAGPLRRAASAAARAERIRAARANTPYQGQAGHVPDTGVTGQPNPPAGWLDMPGVSNQCCGGVLGSRVGRTISDFTVDGLPP